MLTDQTLGLQAVQELSVTGLFVALSILYVQPGPVLAVPCSVITLCSTVPLFFTAGAHHTCVDGQAFPLAVFESQTVSAGM